MIDLFKWGFLVSMGAMWLAVGVGVVALLIPTKPRATKPAVVDQKRAA